MAELPLMAWVKIDDRFAEHPKVLQAGPLAMAMYVAGLCYANRNGTDGHVPGAVAHRLIDTMGLQSTGVKPDAIFASDIATRLVDAGLWERDGDGFVIHDYSDFQPTSRKQQAISAKRAEAGRRGAARRWGSDTNGSSQDHIEDICARVTVALEEEDLDGRDVMAGVDELRLRMKGGDKITSPTKLARTVAIEHRDERVARTRRAAEEKAAREQAEAAKTCAHGVVRSECETCKAADRAAAERTLAQARELLGGES